MSRVVVDVHGIGEYWDGPDKAALEMDRKLVLRIRQLNKTLRGVKADYISEFDYTPEMLNEDGSEWNGSVDTVLLEVGRDDFHWGGYLKHTEQYWETASIPIKKLRILTCPKKELPRYMTSDDEFLKSVAEQRLKEGK